MTVEEAVARFADMPLQFEFELDRRNVSLRELASLRIGQVLPLPRSPAEKVSVRVADTPFAAAEIVGDGTEVQVRITQLVEVDNHR